MCFVCLLVSEAPRRQRRRRRRRWHQHNNHNVYVIRGNSPTYTAVKDIADVDAAMTMTTATKTTDAGEYLFHRICALGLVSESMLGALVASNGPKPGNRKV